MPDADHDERHKSYGPVFSKDIDQDLENWLIIGAADCTGKVLD